jgi:hypothetical protein
MSFEGCYFQALARFGQKYFLVPPKQLVGFANNSEYPKSPSKTSERKFRNKFDGYKYLLRITNEEKLLP